MYVCLYKFGHSHCIEATCYGTMVNVDTFKHCKHKYFLVFRTFVLSFQIKLPPIVGINQILMENFAFYFYVCYVNVRAYYMCV